MEMIKYVIWNRNSISKWDYLYLYYAYIWVIKDVKARWQLRSKTKTLQDIDFYASRKHLCTHAKIKRPLFRFRLILQKKLSFNKKLYLTILNRKIKIFYAKFNIWIIKNCRNIVFEVFECKLNFFCWCF